MVSLKEEPRFNHLEAEFTHGIDAAFADLRNIYLFKNKNYHMISSRSSTRQIADEFKDAKSPDTKSKI